MLGGGRFLRKLGFFALGSLALYLILREDAINASSAAESLVQEALAKRSQELLQLRQRPKTERGAAGSGGAGIGSTGPLPPPLLPGQAKLSQPLPTATQPLLQPPSPPLPPLPPPPPPHADGWMDPTAPLADAPCGALEEEADRFGADVSHAAAGSPSDCCAQCGRELACHAWTFVKAAGVCWCSPFTTPPPLLPARALLFTFTNARASPLSPAPASLHLCSSHQPAPQDEACGLLHPPRYLLRLRRPPRVRLPRHVRPGCTPPRRASRSDRQRCGGGGRVGCRWPEATHHRGLDNCARGGGGGLAQICAGGWDAPRPPSATAAVVRMLCQPAAAVGGATLRGVPSAVADTARPRFCRRGKGWTT
jgi:hypothetical protein